MICAFTQIMFFPFIFFHNETVLHKRYDTRTD